MGGSTADIATKKLFENQEFVVWEMVLEPGQSNGTHTHSRGFYLCVVEGGSVEVTDAQGNSLGRYDVSSGFTRFMRFDGDALVADAVRLPLTHDTRNVGSARYREILIEIK